MRNPWVSQIWATFGYLNLKSRKKSELLKWEKHMGVGAGRAGRGVAGDPELNPKN